MATASGARRKPEKISGLDVCVLVSWRWGGTLLAATAGTRSVGVFTVPVCFPKGGNIPSTHDLTPPSDPRPPQLVSR